MNKQTEALKMAIEALEYNLEWYNIGEQGINKSEQAIQACKEALEQPSWQGLSDDEIKDVWFKVYPLNENNLWADMFDGKHLFKFARAIEQALKEKNS